jgi:hypothetical protein
MQILAELDQKLFGKQREIRDMSELWTYPPFFKRFFLERGFLVRICSLFALARLIFPEGFTLKRFAAARFVFILGIFFLSVSMCLQTYFTATVGLAHLAISA